MSEQRSRQGTLARKDQRTNGSTNRAGIAAHQTRDIRQMNQNRKRQAIDNNNELRVRARNKSMT
jgi:hypothetical protein